MHDVKKKKKSSQTIDSQIYKYYFFHYILFCFGKYNYFLKNIYNAIKYSREWEWERASQVLVL